MRDPYSILGVSKSISDEELKKAYRKLAKKYHPDLNPGDKEIEKKFKEITMAYDIVGDPVKRKKFDQGLIDNQGNDRPGGFYRGGTGARRPGAGPSGGYNPFQDIDPQDIFSDLFNTARRKAGFGEEPPFRQQNMKMPGADVNYSLRIPFLDAARGTKTRISIHNDGKTIEITIPPGTSDGQVLRLKGQGKPGQNGGPNGDAFIEVQVDPDPVFEAKGSNIYMDLPITIYEAIAGATVTVPTTDGKVSLNIPANSNTGNTLRLKNKGLVDPKTKIRGDQYVRLKVMLPDKADKKLTDFIEGWAKKNPYNVRKDFD